MPRTAKQITLPAEYVVKYTEQTRKSALKSARWLMKVIGDEGTVFDIAKFTSPSNIQKVLASPDTATTERGEKYALTSLQTYFATLMVVAALPPVPTSLAICESENPLFFACSSVVAGRSPSEYSLRTFSIVEMRESL